ncbi:MAG: methionine--tRNA ligase subunit beta [Candidatus Sungbacteria bacterium RIFCSPLOWO2_02_FULL_48_13b]|uniref:Methionine--tRNA ligase n=2 Tax=Candidatus Sungiibacteriota TaxID=1817917 RepID=A0A1G2LFV6_9BACT|nr:MAG: methionine--tRNA ligase subunit beta [Candidatus Sungbacteria bacterium RIFCSPHIGHO2_02_FULL_49_20]OHA10508.1 MAG: methionine--tRNA ligase subunit beta [Candidatus Sungbacteria bacterium RIFCSPLOWO2_02_FULL_48_13b]
MISIEDFKKVELKVGRVLSTESVEGSEKLLKLRVQIGDEERQIIAGIAKQYSIEELVGRLIIVVANLEPRILMGFESQGMILAAGDGETIALLMPDKDIPSGTTIR